MKLSDFFIRALGGQPSTAPVTQVSQPTAKANIMTTLSDDFKIMEAHLVAAEPAIKAKWDELVAWVKAKQVTDATEIADLRAKGYTVTPPAALAVPPTA
jgi:hypothetical protein